MAELRERFLRPTDAVTVTSGDVTRGTGSRHAREVLRVRQEEKSYDPASDLARTKIFERRKILSTNHVIVKLSLDFERLGWSDAHDIAKPRDEERIGSQAHAPDGKPGVGAVAEVPPEISNLEKYDPWSTSSRSRTEGDEIWKRINERVEKKLAGLEGHHPEIAWKIRANEELSYEERKIATGAVEIWKTSQPPKGG